MIKVAFEKCKMFFRTSGMSYWRESRTSEPSVMDIFVFVIKITQVECLCFYATYVLASTCVGAYIFDISQI